MIRVLAGVNGAGKSSIGGSAIRAAGLNWYNPDEIAHNLAQRFPQLSAERLNGEIWAEGLRRLQQAIRDDSDFTFETTLGGDTMTSTLLDATVLGRGVSIWYCGLASADLHIERVAARVRRGGHAIPEVLIRSRYRSSMRNLCRLAPRLAELDLYDNSKPLDAQGRPAIRRLLFVSGGRIVEQSADIPQWAEPVVAVCMRSFSRER